MTLKSHAVIKAVATSHLFLSYFQMAEASLNGTFGAFLIGVIASSTLFGVTCTQTWYYFTRYSDSIAVKALVSAIWILGVVHIIFVSHAIYFYAILHYGDSAFIAKIPVIWSVSLNIAVTVVLSISRLGASMGITGYSMYLKYFVLLLRPSMRNLIRATLVLHVVTDLLVAVSLCYYLHKSRTGIRRTNTMINRLMVYAIHTGLITAVVDILVLAFHKIYPENIVYMSVFLILANLYSNSFLATLNARRPTKPIHESTSTDVSMWSLPTSAAQGAVRTNTNSLVLRPCLFFVVTLIYDEQHILNVNITSTVETTGHMDGDVSINSRSKVESL
ncbi:hypothetical protein IW261DRAFT_1592979 [Armillaria novae-zelandiae]|uniref:DUF6534 domain-containing protein n=1 Tax=Armillaria novae-zelandiae TaxID=153914 RepID=A0AA39PBX3_9AGAR|nr:hypothetical protein IW261DRAFT_1592979 [Armillaria novae-zelandiae]